jgi:hypothetical protein
MLVCERALTNDNGGVFNTTYMVRQGKGEWDLTNMRNKA